MNRIWVITVVHSVTVDYVSPLELVDLLSDVQFEIRKVKGDMTMGDDVEDKYKEKLN